MEDPGEKTYGGPDFRLSVTGGNGGGAVSYAVTAGDAVTVTPEGVATILKAGTVQVTASKAGDGEYAAAVSEARTITVNRAPLAITAGNVTVTQGEALPAFTYTTKGLVGTDKLITEPTLTCSAQSSDVLGSFPIVSESADAGENYAIQYRPGTLTVRAKVNPSVPSGGGGFSDEPTTYGITLPKETLGGAVTADRKRAEAGERVLLTVAADAGYELKRLEAKGKNGKTAPVEERGENRYSFTMPGYAVEIFAVFEPEEAVETPPDLPKRSTGT